MLAAKPGISVVYDVKCSQALTEVVRDSGGVPVMWKTGHSYIKAKMHELNADIAGERSGHIFIGGDTYYGFDDAVFVAAKLVEALSHDADNIAEAIARFPQYVTSPKSRRTARTTKSTALSMRSSRRSKHAIPVR